MRSPLLRHPEVLVGLLLLLAPGLARAKTRVLPVSITLTDNAKAQTAQVQYILESAVRRSARHDYVDPVEKFDSVGVEQRRQNLQKAADAMAFGKRAYENLEEGLGIESFNRAIAAYQDSALWDNFRDLSQAEVMRILVRWADDPVGTKKELGALVSMDPRAEFPPDLTPPDLAAEVQKARDARQSEAKFSLDVSTDPVASRVFVDGAYRGTSPTSVRGLTGGDHYLSLVAPGYTVVQKKVRAGPGATATVTLKPAERARPFLTFLERITKGFGENEEVTAARVLARASDSDEVMVASVSRQSGKLSVAMHRVAAKDGHVLAVEQAEIAENDPQFAARVDALATSALALDRPRGKDGEPVGIQTGLRKMVSDVFKISENSVKLGAGITGAVLLTGGLIVGGVALSRESDLRRTPQTAPELRQKRDGVFHTALASDLLTGCGLVAGGVWGWLQFGKKFAKKSDLETPPVLEQKKDAPPPPEKKKPDEDDPFAFLAPLPGVEAFVFPTLGGGLVGVRGSF